MFILIVAKLTNGGHPKEIEKYTLQKKDLPI